jgi:ribosomal-protein-alanine N-acetyltransferase
MLEHKGTVTLETERLILRRFTMDDACAMFQNWANDAEVTKYLTWPTHTDISVSKTVLNSWMELYQNPEHYSWAIVLKEIGEPIGSIAAVEQRDDINMVHIGYCIGRKWWRKGYTSEALSRLVKFFFEDVKAARIESRHDPNNPNSGKVMQKAGLRYEGTLLESDRNNQGICDAARYAILARDYFKNLTPALPVKPVVRSAIQTDIEIVTDLLCELYHMNRDELLEENKQHFSDERQGFFLSFAGDTPIGIAHVSLRSEYVNGTELGGTCGYLEAIFVRPEYRKNGVASELVRSCENWAKEHGCREFASDCLLHNTDSYLFHQHLGFTETERCIFFRKDID